MKKLLFPLVLIILILITSYAVSAEIVSDEGRLPFEDVSVNAWYHEAVVFSYLNGYIQGTSPTAMAPSAPLTREAAVAILARMSGDDLSEYDADSSFLDVKSGQWYTREVNWAYSKGYISGMTPTTFGIRQPITREQFARILLLYISDRYTIPTFVPDISHYRDNPQVSDWAYEAMSFCVYTGIIQGTSEDTLSPRTLLTRAQMTVLIKNIALGYNYAHCEHSFSESSCTLPRFCRYCGVKTALPKGHRCDLLTCVSGSNCKSCGSYIPPDKALHSYTRATCTLPSACTYCGDISAKALGHSYRAASCTVPKTCIRCNAVTGKTLDHTTYNGVCAMCNKYNYRTKILSAPYIDQRHNWPNGCEAVTTVMALRYHKVDISVDHFIDGYMPVGPAPKPGGYGPDPNKVYCGDPYSEEGWGCFSPAIVKSLNNLLTPQYWTIDHSYSMTMSRLCDRYIDNDIPVIIWATVNMRNASASANYAYWTTDEGRTVAYNRSLHCLLLVGYDKDNYYFNDPMKPGDGTSYIAYPKAKVETAYKLLGSQSIAFYPK